MKCFERVIIIIIISTLKIKALMPVYLLILVELLTLCPHPLLQNLCDLRINYFIVTVSGFPNKSD